LAALQPADGVNPSPAQLELLKATMDTTPAGKQIPDAKAVVQHASLTTAFPNPVWQYSMLITSMTEEPVRV
jgi:hypothetical protein